jgi:hypothetical protein
VNQIVSVARATNDEGVLAERVREADGVLVGAAKMDGCLAQP